VNSRGDKTEGFPVFRLCNFFIELKMSFHATCYLSDLEPDARNEVLAMISPDATLALYDAGVLNEEELVAMVLKYNKKPLKLECGNGRTAGQLKANNKLPSALRDASPAVRFADVAALVAGASWEFRRKKQEAVYMESSIKEVTEDDVKKWNRKYNSTADLHRYDGLFPITRFAPGTWTRWHTVLSLYTERRNDFPDRLCFFYTFFETGDIERQGDGTIVFKYKASSRYHPSSSVDRACIGLAVGKVHVDGSAVFFGSEGLQTFAAFRKLFQEAAHSCERCGKPHSTILRCQEYEEILEDVALMDAVALAQQKNPEEPTYVASEPKRFIMKSGEGEHALEIPEKVAKASDVLNVSFGEEEEPLFPTDEPLFPAVGHVCPDSFPILDRMVQDSTYFPHKISDMLKAWSTANVIGLTSIARSLAARLGDMAFHAWDVLLGDEVMALAKSNRQAALSPKHPEPQKKRSREDVARDDFVAALVRDDRTACQNLLTEFGPCIRQNREMLLQHANIDLTFKGRNDLFEFFLERDYADESLLYDDILRQVKNVELYRSFRSVMERTCGYAALSAMQVRELFNGLPVAETTTIDVHSRLLEMAAKSKVMEFFTEVAEDIWRVAPETFDVTVARMLSKYHVPMLMYSLENNYFKDHGDALYPWILRETFYSLYVKRDIIKALIRLGLGTPDLSHLEMYSHDTRDILMDLPEYQTLVRACRDIPTIHKLLRKQGTCPMRIVRHLPRPLIMQFMYPEKHVVNAFVEEGYIMDAQTLVYLLGFYHNRITLEGSTFSQGILTAFGCWSCADKEVETMNRDIIQAVPVEERTAFLEACLSFLGLGRFFDKHSWNDSPRVRDIVNLLLDDGVTVSDEFYEAVYACRYDRQWKNDLVKRLL
jgi:hypothetical protein